MIEDCVELGIELITDCGPLGNVDDCLKAAVLDHVAFLVFRKVGFTDSFDQTSAKVSDDLIELRRDVAVACHQARRHADLTS